MPRYCDRNLSPVHRVLLEIVDTEAIYVEHLRQVIQVGIPKFHHFRFQIAKQKSSNKLLILYHFLGILCDLEKRSKFADKGRDIEPTV